MYIKRYPLSIAAILAVIFLSFFRPPTLSVPDFPQLDKVAHVCMYAMLSGLLWLEFMYNHRYNGLVLWHGWIGALVCPIVFGGVIELLQMYCTTYRGGEWFDFLANTGGVVLATLFMWFVVQPVFFKKRNY